MLKLVRTAAETATVPGKVGRAVPEIVFDIAFPERSDSPGFDRLLQWAVRQDGANDRIAALLAILRQCSDDEIVDKIAQEWSGYSTIVKVTDIRRWLKKIGQEKAYAVKGVTQEELGSQLWRFLPRLFRAAGYNGWVVLFDEVELMLRYTKVQRAKSYAHLAALAGKTTDFAACGLLPVFAVTGDFWVNADGPKKQDSDIPERLRDQAKQAEQLAKCAEQGMGLLKRTMPLRPALPEELAQLKDKVRRLHSQAFEWEAPPSAAAEVLASDSVREHVKSWITQWDMMLLYPGYRPDIVADEVEHDYAEDADLSREDQEAESAPG